MKKDLTELVFILDRSSSMSGLESDTVGGYNGILSNEKAQPGEALVTTVLFDDRYELLHDRINLKGIQPITEKEYFVRGSTALLDAIGKTIDKIGRAHKHTLEDERPEKTLFVITTDGMENASREYRAEDVRHMIERQKTKYGWEFLFLGANIDAVKTARDFGIAPDRAADYHADAQGTKTTYQAVACAVSQLRGERAIRPDWKKNVDEDFKGRSRR